MSEQYYSYTYDNSQTSARCSTVDTSQPATITIPIAAKSFNDTISVRIVLRKNTMNKRQWKKLSKNGSVIKQCGSYVIAYQEAQNEQLHRKNKTR